MKNNNRIKQRRLELSLTLEDVALKVGVNRSTVQRWEAGTISNLGQDKIARLSAALQVTPEYLLGWSDDPDVKMSNDIAAAVIDLTADETDSVLRYIAFLRSQRRHKKDEKGN